MVWCGVEKGDGKGKSERWGEIRGRGGVGKRGRRGGGVKG